MSFVMNALSSLRGSTRKVRLALVDPEGGFQPTVGNEIYQSLTAVAKKSSGDIELVRVSEEDLMAGTGLRVMVVVIDSNARAGNRRTSDLDVEDMRKRLSARYSKTSGVLKILAVGSYSDPLVLDNWATAFSNLFDLVAGPFYVSGSNLASNNENSTHAILKAITCHFPLTVTSSSQPLPTTHTSRGKYLSRAQSSRHSSDYASNDPSQRHSSANHTEAGDQAGRSVPDVEPQRQVPPASLWSRFWGGSRSPADLAELFHLAEQLRDEAREEKYKALRNAEMYRIREAELNRFIDACVSTQVHASKASESCHHTTRLPHTFK